MFALRAFTLILLVLIVQQCASSAVPQATTIRHRRNMNNRVVGGETAENGFAPYQASLQTMFNEIMCGAVIIGDHWVLTAAHCVYGYNPPYLKVATGSNNWKQPGAVYNVAEYWTHCNYGNPDYHNDIALIYVNETIQMNENTQPIKLPVEQMKDGDDVILTGWGMTELWGNEPELLQKITLKYLKNEQCKEMWKETGEEAMVDIGHVCTFTKTGEGSCYGDSGGPLVSNGYLVGLVNFGMPCAVGLPDAFASILFYRDWIRKTMSHCKTCQCYASNYGVK